LKPSIEFAQREDGVRIAYSKFGKGSTMIYPAPWVTNLSFFLEDQIILNFWMALAENFTIVLYDKSGCGLSDKFINEISIESEMLDLQAVIKSLELKKVILFAASAAGPLSIKYAVSHPNNVHSLILYGSYARGKDTANEDVRSALVNLVKSAWGLGSKALTDIFIPGASKELHEAYAKFQRKSCSAEIAAQILKTHYSYDVSNLLSKIPVPTLILHRQNDKVCKFELGREMAMRIPNARFKVLQGSTHFPWLDDSVSIIKEIQGFIYKDENLNNSYTNLQDREFSEPTTIVFTDIVSSTNIVNAEGDSVARNVFLMHDKIITNEVKKYGGKELQNLGDGFMLSFTSASAAIQCCYSIQNIISQELPIVKIRIAINSGEVLMREKEKPFGQAVVLASRILSKCKGGDIIVSEVTKQLTLGSKFTFKKKGKFLPKGFKEKIRLYEVCFSD
jgi:pimeloyl-ACP methyl ester carboxylesterase/class 3 adenylate cyclase